MATLGNQNAKKDPLLVADKMMLLKVRESERDFFKELAAVRNQTVAQTMRDALHQLAKRHKMEYQEPIVD